MTSSQEVGWDKEIKIKRFCVLYSKNTCDVTRYASEYTYLKGRSPFASTKVAPKAKETK